MVDKVHSQQDNGYANTLMQAFIDLANNDIGAQKYQVFYVHNIFLYQRSCDFDLGFWYTRYHITGYVPATYNYNVTKTTSIYQ